MEMSLICIANPNFCLHHKFVLLPKAYNSYCLEAICKVFCRIGTFLELFATLTAHLRVNIELTVPAKL